MKISVYSVLTVTVRSAILIVRSFTKINLSYSNKLKVSIEFYCEDFTIPFNTFLPWYADPWLKPGIKTRQIRNVALNWKLMFSKQMHKKNKTLIRVHRAYHIQNTLKVLNLTTGIIVSNVPLLKHRCIVWFIHKFGRWTQTWHMNFKSSTHKLVFTS